MPLRIQRFRSVEMFLGFHVKLIKLLEDSEISFSWKPSFFGFHVLNFGGYIGNPKQIALKHRANGCYFDNYNYCLSTSAYGRRCRHLMMCKLHRFSSKVFPNPKQKHQLLSNLRNIVENPKLIINFHLYFFLQYTLFHPPPVVSPLNNKKTHKKKTIVPSTSKSSPFPQRIVKTFKL